MSEVIVEHKPHMPLTGRALKCTVALSPAEILAQPVPEGRPRIVLRIRVPDRTVTADIATKSLRRAQATIREAGSDNCVCILQGKLVAGDAVLEAGLSVQLKAKAEAAPQNGAGE